MGNVFLNQLLRPILLLECPPFDSVRRYPGLDPDLSFFSVAWNFYQ